MARQDLTGPQALNLHGIIQQIKKMGGWDTEAASKFAEPK